jgi:glucose/arabinose dehydrogenase
MAVILVSIAPHSAKAGENLVHLAATTPNLPTSTPTYGYAAAPAFGGLAFQQPTQVVFAPGDTQRAFVVELGGRIEVVSDLNLSAPQRSVFLDLSSRMAGTWIDHGLLSMVFHPRYAENGFFYVWYSLMIDGVRANRLSRFQRSATNPAQADAASEQPLLTQSIGPGGHDGGILLFGPDGYLYLSLGDGFESAAANASRQHVDQSFFGAVLRLDVDQKPENLVPNAHASVHAGTYRVPADNPFVGATIFNGLPVEPAKVRSEFWAVGLRNPFRMAFDQTTGRLWCADVGLDTAEEINLIVRGGNYGWNYGEGSSDGPRSSSAPPGFTSVAPLFEYRHQQGRSITGGVVYRGTRFAGLQGKYLFADYVSGRIWALTDDGSRPVPEANVTQLATETGVVGFTVNPADGDILIVDHDSNQIKKLVSLEPESSSRLVNLSVRTRAGAGDQTLIMGFAVDGSAPAHLVARALGPTLVSFGVEGALADPQLNLFNASHLQIDQNDDWGGGSTLTESFSRLGATPLVSSSKDAALSLSPAAGAYSLHVTGVGSATGIVLAELYDAGESGSASLINASARSLSGTGADVLILGFVLHGQGTRTLLLRGVGPTLTDYGVSSALADPQLKLYRDGAVLAENDDWGGSVVLRDAFGSVGAFNFSSDSSKDAALLVTLQPGVYSVIVQGAKQTSGVALVEIYEIR